MARRGGGPDVGRTWQRAAKRHERARILGVPILGVLAPGIIILPSLCVTAGEEFSKKSTIVAFFVCLPSLPPGDRTGSCLFENSAPVPGADETFLGHRGDEAAVMRINEPPRQPPRAF
jgi:hypothetical protein